MPKGDFTSVLRAAAESGYLKFSADGTLELDNKAPARMKSYLKSIFEQRAEEAHAEKQGISIKEWARILEEERLERERQARLAVASSQLERHWRRIGGPKSIVGLPLGNRIEAQEVISADGKRSYKALFRGGPLQIMDNGSPFGAVQEVIVVNIRLCGIECAGETPIPRSLPPPIAKSSTARGREGVLAPTSSRPKRRDPFPTCFWVGPGFEFFGLPSKGEERDFSTAAHDHRLRSK